MYVLSHVHVTLLMYGTENKLLQIKKILVLIISMKFNKSNCIPSGPILTGWSPLWQYRLWSFQMGDTKLERFLPKNQHTQGNY